ncbi:MAG: hypothetical protein PHD43_20410 [Methylococcales bacterium]|nr:hypothetical protein [Methylococcales bacterium]
MVDLTQGGIATGTLTNGAGGNRKVVNVAGLPLQDCIALLALNNNAAQLAVATNLCTAHYAKFIDPGAVAGAQATLATDPFLNQVTPAAQPVLPNDAIGGCVTPSATCTVTGNLAKAKVTLLAIDRGLNRFFAGNTACGVCHVTPQFTLQTVAGLTGFGAAAPLPEPPGLLRKAPPERPMERMVAFNGAAAVYDAGFYNIGIRPTPEDLMIGDQIGGVPLAFSKLAEIIAGGDATGFDANKIGRIAAEFTGGLLQIPTSPTNLAPRPWSLDLICGPGLNGNGNGEPNNNPIPRCVTNVIPGERLLRHGAAHTPTLRNVKFTGPYFHNGAKMNLNQVFETYATAGHMTTLNFNNLDAGMRLINIAPEEKAAVIEMMETGLTDWRVAFEKGKFDHPEICVPNGHDPVTGETKLAGILPVGSDGNANRLQTFEEQLNGVTTGRAQTLADDCTVPDVSDIDVPPAPL